MPEYIKKRRTLGQLPARVPGQTNSYNNKGNNGDSTMSANFDRQYKPQAPCIAFVKLYI